MNGQETTYFDKKFNDLKNIVIEVKTENKVKWEEHNKRSEDLQGWLSSELSELKIEDRNHNAFLNNLPCDSHSEKLKSFRWQIGLLWGFLLATITIFGIVLNIVNSY